MKIEDLLVKQIKHLEVEDSEGILKDSVQVMLESEDKEWRVVVTEVGAKKSLLKRKVPYDVEFVTEQTELV